MTESGGSRDVKLRLSIFLILFAGFWIAALSIERITLRFSSLQVENYASIARRAIAAKDYRRAQQVLTRRIDKVFYDFDAHYLLAETYAAQGLYKEAAETIRTVLRKVPAARANPVRSLGYDEPKTYYLLARYLWLAGQYLEAGEIARAALDAGHPLVQGEMTTYLTGKVENLSAAVAIAKLAMKLKAPEAFAQALRVLRNGGEEAAANLLLAEWMDRVRKMPVGADVVLRAARSMDPQNPSLVLAQVILLNKYGGDAATSESKALLASLRSSPGIQEIGTGAFRVTEGQRITPSTLVLGRNGRATAKVVTSAFRPKRLTFVASGTWAIGLYPIVLVRCDGKEVQRLYLDNPDGRVYDLELWPQGAPKQIELEFEFTNDAFEPYTRADRNVQIKHLFLY